MGGVIDKNQQLKTCGGTCITNYMCSKACLKKATVFRDAFTCFINRVFIIRYSFIFTRLSQCTCLAH